jgi:hypothetical protein
MTDFVRAAGFAALVAMIAAPTLLIADGASAAEKKRKLTPAQAARQEAKTFCPYWKPIDMAQYKACMARSR